MINNDEIKKKLVSLGAPESKLEKIIEDVSLVITQEAALLFMKRLNVEDREQLVSLPTDQAAKFVEDHPETALLVSQADLEMLREKIWKKYFEDMKS